jgi:hypothetical protein
LEHKEAQVTMTTSTCIHLLLLCCMSSSLITLVMAQVNGSNLGAGQHQQGVRVLTNLWQQWC